MRYMSIVPLTENWDALLTNAPHTSFEAFLELLAWTRPGISEFQAVRR